MNNSLKTFLSFMLLLIFSMGAAQADCIVTTKNFSKSSRVIYVNPTNGSDQLAKIYNYNLGNQRNPYEPKRIVAFQNLNEALANRNTRNGDLVLVKTGRTWTKYDDWSQNKSSEFNKQSAQASGYSQRQCQGESLTWVPSAVTVTQSADTAPTTEFANTDDITVANTEIVAPQSTSPTQVATASQSSTSPTTSRRSSGGSSSGGASSGSNTSSPIPDATSAPQQNDTSPYSRASNKQNTLTDPPLQDEVIAELDPSLTEGEVIDEDVAPVANEPENLNQDYAAKCTADAPWGNAIHTYPQDSDGWSIIKPDIDTRIVYVSSSEGNDSLAKPYSGISINNPFNPVNIQAYKTIEKAYAQIRGGKPDWILFKKGDHFDLVDKLWLKSGKSKNAHMVFGAYGDANAKRPLIDSNTSAVMQGIKDPSFITINGIEFYASGRDPSSPKFVEWGKGPSAIASVSGKVIDGMHFENNKFSFYGGAIILGGIENGKNKNIVIRRNQILNSYSAGNHSQGMFLSRLSGALIEENFIDHNGWFQQRPLNVAMNSSAKGYATFFNHNIYFENSENLVIRKNLLSRSSSIGIKFASNSSSVTKMNTVNSSNILIENNVITEGEVGLSIGGNTDFNNGYRWDNIQVKNNILTNVGRTRPTNRNIAFNIEVNDWKSGEVCSNYILDKEDTTLTNTKGISVVGHIGDVVIAGNNLINLGINNAQYDSQPSIKNVNNTYISRLENINFLDKYVKSKGYANYTSYIKNVTEELGKDPLSYYKVSDIFEYIKSQALNEKNKHME